MKKRFAVISIVITLFMVFASVVQAEQQYTLEELSMNVSIPDEYEVAIRGSENESSYMPEFNTSREDLLNFMGENDIYLDAFDYDSNSEILVIAKDFETIDFNFISDEMLAEVMEELGSDWGNIKVTQKEIYENDSMKYIKFYGKAVIDHIEQYRVQYYTCYNGKAFNIFFVSFVDEISADDESKMKGIVDSIVYDAVKPDITAEAFAYIDPYTQLSFNVPAGYTQAEDVDENGLMTFESEQNYTMNMMFGSKDIWDEVSEYKRTASSRLEIDHSALLEEEIILLTNNYYNGEIEFVGNVSYGNKEFFKCKVTEVYGEGDDEVTIEMVMLIHIEDGYLYSFLCTAKEGSVYYSDFEALVSGVKYPQISKEQLTADYMENLGLDLILSLIFTFVIYSLPIVIYRYGIRKFCLEKNKALKVTIIYGICAFVVMTCIKALLGATPSSTAIFIWSFINYLMLSKGRDSLSNYNTPDVINRSNVNADYNFDGIVMSAAKPVNYKPIADKTVQIKTKELYFTHTCPRCGNKFKIRYNMPEYKKEIPNLEVVCPKCKVKITVKSEELKK